MFDMQKMEFREIYCSNCKKILGRYNIKFYSEDKIGEVFISQIGPKYNSFVSRFNKTRYKSQVVSVSGV